MAKKPTTVEECAAIVMAEYKYWREADDPAIDDIVIGATGALSNVLAAFHGLIPPRDSTDG